MTATDSPQDAVTRFGRWICELALPFWCGAGRDEEFGFVERLGFSGAVAPTGFLRCRLLARQVAVYAQASRWSNMPSPPNMAGKF